MVLRTSVLVIVFCLFVSNISEADILPPGHKNVRHSIVFVQSDALKRHQIVAAPIAGLKGETEVQADVPISFSTKYGTRFYVLPNDQAAPEFDRDTYEQWPACQPPVSEIRSVPVYSPVASALTTVKLVDVGPDGPVIKIVSHETFDANGNPASINPLRNVRTYFVLIPVFIGMLGCFALFMRRQASSASEDVGG